MRLKMISNQVWLLLALAVVGCTSAPINEGTYIHKEISVKSTPHRVSHIDHFNPAGHVYAAHGEVDIARNRLSDIQDGIKGNNGQKIYSVPVKTFTSDVISDDSLLRISKLSSIEPKVNLQKIVSINQPSNIISSINHFNPAGHEYEGTGNVQINRQSVIKQQEPIQIQKSNSFIVPAIPIIENQPKTFIVQKKQYSTVSKNQILNNNIGSVQSLEKSVSVKSPERTSTVIDHFNPAGHQYAATGSVKINKQSFVQQPQQLTVLKQKQPSFVPQKSEVTFIRKTKPFVIPNHEKLAIIKSSSLSSGSNSVAYTNTGSHLNLEKSVSVKSPQRVSSVIDHFTPASHLYAATGNVKINRQSLVKHESPIIVEKKVKQLFLQPEYYISEKVPELIVVPEVAVIKKSEVFVVPTQKLTSTSHSKSSSLLSNFGSLSNNGIVSDINLEKSVSVKSPQRSSSVISHFTPAGHEYAATGNVKITRFSQNIEQIPKITVNNNLQSIVFPEVPKATVIKSDSFIVPGNLQSSIYKTKPISSGSGYVVTKKEGSSSILQKGTGSGISIEKFVSVKSPQRVSSVIDHFTPAGHQYAATGNVKINRQNIIKPQVAEETIINHEQSSFLVPNKQIINVYEEQLFTVPNKQSINVFEGQSLTVPKKQKKLITKSKVLHQEQPLELISTTSSLSSGSGSFLNKNIGSGLNIEKTVSVKSPQIISTVIDHFTPAGHQYAATGNVKISKQSYVKQQPSRVIITKKIVPFTVRESPKIIVVKESQSLVVPEIPRVTEKKTTQSYVVPVVPKATIIKKAKDINSPSKKQVSVSKLSSSSLSSQFINKNIGSSFNLEKTVSVKSPEIISSVISHFTPAGHIYAASGNVKINRPASTKQIPKATITKKSQTYVVPETEKVIKKTETLIFPTKGKTIVSKSKESSLTSGSASFSGNKIASGLSIERTVSVKSPQRVSTVIDHFTPAGHNYAATGSVKIIKQSIDTETNYTPIQLSLQEQNVGQASIGTFSENINADSSNKVVAEESISSDSSPINVLDTKEEEYAESDSGNINVVDTKEEEYTDTVSHDISEEENENDDEESAIFIKVSSAGSSEEDEDDSDESGESELFGVFNENVNDYLPPVNQFIASYLPPSNNYVPQSTYFATNDLPPIS